MGGMYDVENNNITVKYTHDARRFMQFVLHETVHLIVQPIVDDWKLSHWEKEYLVDRFMSQIFDGYVMQEKSIYTDVVNKIKIPISRKI